MVVVISARCVACFMFVSYSHVGARAPSTQAEGALGFCNSAAFLCALWHSTLAITSTLPMPQSHMCPLAAKQNWIAQRTLVQQHSR